jgi:hypothetical protein
MKRFPARVLASARMGPASGCEPQEGHAGAIERQAGNFPQHHPQIHEHEDEQNSCVHKALAYRVQCNVGDRGTQNRSVSSEQQR